MLCGDEIREQLSNLEEEEEENTIPANGRVYNSQKRGPWQLKENKTKQQQQNPPHLLEDVLNSQTRIFNQQFIRARLNCLQNIKQF